MDVSEAVLSTCRSESDFTALAFELYKATASVLTVCAHATPTEDSPLNRDQAVCAGLLVRIVKFMKSVLQLTNANHGDVVLALNRSILESATNLQFLVTKNDSETYEEFIRSGLAPERELYDRIKTNIHNRGGARLPIEERMLQAIETSSRLAGMNIEEIEPRFQDWGGNLRARLKELGKEELYLYTQRIASHAVHGTWHDLVLHHLSERDGGFIPDPSWTPVDTRLLSPPCIYVLECTESYLDVFFRDLPEAILLHERISDLKRRIFVLDSAHEKWKSTPRS